MLLALQEQQIVLLPNNLTISLHIKSNHHTNHLIAISLGVQINQTDHKEIILSTKDSHLRKVHN